MGEVRDGVVGSELSAADGAWLFHTGGGGMILAVFVQDKELFICKDP